MIPLLLVFVQAPATDAAVLLARYHEQTRVERGCVIDPDSADLTVCGRRQADRFRVPLVGREEGDETDNVPYERAALVRRRSPVEELSPFLVEGGMVGVSAGTRSGVHGYKARELAP